MWVKQIVTQRGKQIFDKSKSAQLEGLLSDYLTDDKARLKLFRKAINENVAHELLQADTLGAAEKTIKLNTLKNKFQSENFLEKDVAYEIADCFAYALGWIKTVENQTISKTVDKNAIEVTNTNQKPKLASNQSGTHEITFQNIINRRDKWGNTQLHDAVSNNNITVVKSLIKAGAEIDVQNIFGESPLYVAACRNNEKIMEILLQAGANSDDVIKASNLKKSAQKSQPGKTTVSEQTPQTQIQQTPTQQSVNEKMSIAGVGLCLLFIVSFGLLFFLLVEEVYEVIFIPILLLVFSVIGLIMTYKKLANK